MEKSLLVQENLVRTSVGHNPGEHITEANTPEKHTLENHIPGDHTPGDHTPGDHTPVDELVRMVPIVGVSHGIFLKALHLFLYHSVCLYHLNDS